MTCPRCGGSGWRFEKRGSLQTGWVHMRVECECGAAERERERRAKADEPRLRAFWEAKEGSDA